MYPDTEEDIAEIIDFVITGREFEFEWRGKSYVLQPESQWMIEDANDPLPLNDGGTYMVIYQFEPEYRYHYLVQIFPDETLYEDPDRFVKWPVGERAAQQVLNAQCLDGKSFLERIDEIYVSRTASHKSLRHLRRSVESR